MTNCSAYTKPKPHINISAFTVIVAEDSVVKTAGSQLEAHNFKNNLNDPWGFNHIKLQAPYTHNATNTFNRRLGFMS